MSIIGSREENNKSNYSISEWEVLVGKKMVFWPALSEDAMAQIADFDLDVVTLFWHRSVELQPSQVPLVFRKHHRL